jgi:NDP-sugar pyrophosphorylase family protein
MMLPVAILAGGLATRLRPITTTIPKALISIGNRSFIEWQLSYLRSQGITRVVICSGYLSSQIQAVVGDGSKFNLDLLYSEDGPNLLGTGGALKKALPFLGDSFFVLYGDSFLPVEFLPIQTAFENSNKLDTIRLFIS